ncbi:MAG: hypothetical protein HC771_04400 [Synechococcales cyanobacterium CRU_2_2]|nr:hypothetical protein [Synechococcales cyanobacterium CRU_2_2]
MFSSASAHDSNKTPENIDSKVQSPRSAIRARVFAIATFDTNGILEHSEFCHDRPAADWAEAVFAAISFKGLLDAMLNHQPFRYAKVTSDSHVVFLVRRRRRYVALLTEPPESWAEEAEIRASLQTMGTGDLLELVRSLEVQTQAVS